MALRTAATWLLLALGLPATAPALSDDIQTGWAAWFNSQKLSGQWGLVSDVQLRSNDDYEGVRTLLARAAVTHAWGSNTIAAGYAYVQTYDEVGPDLTEHRLWQQLVVPAKLGSKALTHRLRLEQRFIDRPAGADVYSDRFRYFARLIVPVGKRDAGAFASGNFVALQNEIFLNLSGRDRLNGKVFDQNRAYVAFGRRLHVGLDVELGYLQQHVEGRVRDTRNHALQFAFYTRH